MNWMNIVELNIFVIITYVLIFIALFVIVIGFSNRLDKHKKEIKELKTEVNELKNYIKE